MQRYALRDDQWTKIKDFLPGGRATSAAMHPITGCLSNAVVYRYRTGIPWRDLPERYGDWKATAQALPEMVRKWCVCTHSGSFGG